MPIYEISVSINPSTRVTFVKEKNTPKAAYEYAISEGLDIFGRAPDGIQVVEMEAEV